MSAAPRELAPSLRQMNFACGRPAPNLTTLSMSWFCNSAPKTITTSRSARSVDAKSASSKQIELRGESAGGSEADASKRTVSPSHPFGTRTNCFACRQSLIIRELMVTGLGQELYLASLRPTPRKLHDVVAGNATGPDHRPPSARQQDGRHHRRSPRSVCQATAVH